MNMLKYDLLTGNDFLRLTSVRREIQIMRVKVQPRGL